MSGLDKTLTNAYYEFEIDPATKMPVRIRLTVLTGRRGATETKGAKIVGGTHVAFHFDYRLGRFDEVDEPEIPREAQTLLARLK